MIIRRTRCLLCGLELEPLSSDHGVQRHPAVDTCGVTLTDAFGVALSVEEIKIFEAIVDDPTVAAEPEFAFLQLHPPVELAVPKMFDAFELPPLGGPSTGKGWSSYALAQRCLYAWRKRYLEKAPSPLLMERQALAIGTLLHTFLALHYANMMGDYAALTPDAARDFLARNADPNLVQEGWRVFAAYRLYYDGHDDLKPLAVEHDLKDPRTGESCRYDLIAYFPQSTPTRRRGTYVFEHKSSGRFDWDTLDGWANDGEVIGEAALWKRLGLDHRFGPLRGVVVNICGKQKEPKFHRTTVAPESLLIDAHLDDLRRWDGLLALSRATGNWPRSRANCINRWGRCEWWEHCTTGQD